MQIKRTLDTVKATYDIIGLSKQQFRELLNSYERQQYIYRHCPPAEDDELYNKMKKIDDSDIVII